MLSFLLPFLKISISISCYSVSGGFRLGENQNNFRGRNRTSSQFKLLGWSNWTWQKGAAAAIAIWLVLSRWAHKEHSLLSFIHCKKLQGNGNSHGRFNSGLSTLSRSFFMNRVASCIKKNSSLYILGSELEHLLDNLNEKNSFLFFLITL